MRWPERLTQWLIADRQAEMAERLAGRSRLAVWQRIAERLAFLEPLEARGYIRARATAIIEIEADRLVQQEGPRVGKIRDRVVALATYSLVETIVAQVAQRRRSGSKRQAA